MSVAPDAPHFLEATVFAKDHAVIMAGEFADAPADRSLINPLGRWHKPWFFKHVETFLWRDQPGEEYIPLRHYLMRHNRSIFWVVADMIPFGNHPVFRWLLGWLMPPRIAFIKFSTHPRRARDDLHEAGVPGHRPADERHEPRHRRLAPPLRDVPCPALPLPHLRPR
jgi:delta24-sterol reductase